MSLEMLTRLYLVTGIVLNVWNMIQKLVHPKGEK